MNRTKRLGGWRRGYKLIVAGLLALSFVAGCANQNPYLYSGAGLGGALGAGIGAAANSKNPWKGAAIGGLLGVAAGGVAGEVYGRSNPYYSSSSQGYYQQPQQQGYYQQPQYGSYQQQYYE